MQHCVNTYADDVAAGERYVYSITEDGERVATLELLRTPESAAIDQVRGPCNAIAPDAVVTVRHPATRRWSSSGGSTNRSRRLDGMSVREIKHLDDEAHSAFAFTSRVVEGT